MAKQSKFTIKNLDGTEEERVGYIVKCYDEWGVDKRSIKNGDKVDGWFITHIPTGALLTNTKSKLSAQKLLSEPEFYEPININKIKTAVERYFNREGWDK